MGKFKQIAIEEQELAEIMEEERLAKIREALAEQLYERQLIQEEFNFERDSGARP